MGPVGQDKPGFILNALLVPFNNDAIRAVEAGVASACRYRPGHQGGAGLQNGAAGAGGSGGAGHPVATLRGLLSQHRPLAMTTFFWRWVMFPGKIHPSVLGLIWISISTLLIGCASEHMQVIPREAIGKASHPSAATVFFIRQSLFFSGQVPSHVAVLEGDEVKLVGSLLSFQETLYRFKPGRRLFLVFASSMWKGFTSPDKLEVTLEGGEVRYYAIRTNPNGRFSTNKMFSFEMITEDEMENLRYKSVYWKKMKNKFVIRNKLASAMDDKLSKAFDFSK